VAACRVLCVCQSDGVQLRPAVGVLVVLWQHVVCCVSVGVQLRPAVGVLVVLWQHVVCCV